MAEEQMIVIECPKCGRKSEYVVFDVLNSEIDHFEKQQLLNDTLFESKCECGCISGLLYELVYHDVNHNTMIYLVDEDHVEGVYTGLAMTYRAMEKAGMPTIRNRIVCDANRFREKAIISECGFDDRVIEIMKLFCLAEAHEEGVGLDNPEIYFCAVNGKYSFEMYSGEKVLSAEIEDGFYEHIAFQFADYLVDDCDPMINEEWAMGVLEEDGMADDEFDDYDDFDEDPGDGSKGVDL